MGSNTVKILESLARQGYTVVADTVPGRFLVDSVVEHRFVGKPVLDLPEVMVGRYVNDLSGLVAYAADPHEEALSIAGIHILENLDADDGGGLNAVKTVGLREGPEGRVELFVERFPLASGGPEGQTFEWTSERPSGNG